MKQNKTTKHNKRVVSNECGSLPPVVFLLLKSKYF